MKGDSVRRSERFRGAGVIEMRFAVLVALVCVAAGAYPNCTANTGTGATCSMVRGVYDSTERTGMSEHAG